MTSLVDAESLLAIDIGSVNTRAMLFDVAEGHYYFVAVGAAPTTAGAPFKDISEGVRLALDQLQEVTGRKLVGEDERLIIPGRPNGSGVDKVVSTYSAGPTLRTVAVGLLEDVSLESAQRLIQTTYASAVESIGLNDRRKEDAQIDAIIRAAPDLIVIAGGTEQGATRSVMKLLETVGLASYLLPNDRRPEVLYVGNQALEAKVKSSLEAFAPLHFASNIRPAFDLEDLGPAQGALAEIYDKIYSRKVEGVSPLKAMTSGGIAATASAFGRVIRFLSQLYDPAKGVLGVDVGASATTVATGLAGKLALNLFRPLGVGEGLSGLMEQTRLQEIHRWLPMHVPEEYLRDYVMHKIVNPGSLPATLEDLAIEQALARQVLRTALKNAARGNGAGVFSASGGLNRMFEPILASGAVLTRAPTPGQSALMLLDGLQPIGVTTLVLDQNNLTAALGAAANVNALLPVHVLESGAYLALGTVVTAISDAKYGSTILRVRLTQEDGAEASLQVKQGSIGVLPLARGQKARLALEPTARTDVGMGRPGKGGNIRVTGGALGLIIDARGRPINLPADTPRRREMIKKWLWTLGN